MIGFAVLVFSAALLVGASVAARALAARALGAGGSTWWLFTAPFRWETRGAARWLGVVAASALSSYLVAALLAAAGVVLSGTDRVDTKSMVVEVAPNGPAATAGVRDGDRVVEVDGVAVGDWNALKRAISERAAQPVVLTIRRGGETLRVEVTPNDDGKILIAPQTVTEPVPIGVAVRDGLALPPRVWFATVRGLARELTGDERVTVSGPVGIVRETEKAARRRGVGRALAFAGGLAAYGFPILVLYAMLVTPARSARR